MRFVLVVSGLLGLAALATAQKPEKVPIKPAPAESGQAMFSQYCAVCHGKDAKGSGPVAPALIVPPPDLTTLSKRNNGKFPADYFTTVLKSGVNAPAHGSVEMPIWGSTFADAKTQRIVTIRVNDLMQYLESLQTK